MRTIESIVEMAETLAEVHRRDEHPGGDPYFALRDNKIRLFEREFKDSFDGMLVYNQQKFSAFINTRLDCTPERQRFTAAHEFGHFAIEHHNEGVRTGKMLHPSVTGFVSHVKYEEEADMFAAHFLMPTTPFLRLCKRAKEHWGAEQVLDVSRAFGTSLTSSARRCVEALPGESLLYVWQGDNVHWVIGGGNWVEHQRAWRVKNRTDLVKGSATESALANPTSGAPFTKGTSTLAHWSRRVGPSSFQNAIVTEYAICRGRYGLMTLLRPAD